jgi:hypothetical protein
MGEEPFDSAQRVERNTVTVHPERSRGTLPNTEFPELTAF